MKNKFKELSMELKGEWKGIEMAFKERDLKIQQIQTLTTEIKTKLTIIFWFSGIILTGLVTVLFKLFIK